MGDAGLAICCAQPLRASWIRHCHRATQAARSTGSQVRSPRVCRSRVHTVSFSSRRRMAAGTFANLVAENVLSNCDSGTSSLLRYMFMSATHSLRFYCSTSTVQESQRAAVSVYRGALRTAQALPLRRISIRRPAGARRQGQDFQDRFVDTVVSNSEQAARAAPVSECARATNDNC